MKTKEQKRRKLSDIEKKKKKKMHALLTVFKSIYSVLNKKEKTKNYKEKKEVSANS